MRGLRKSDVVAALLPPGPAWLDLLGDAWERGCAVLPVDHRLPEPEIARLLAAARPTALLRDADLVRFADGVPVEPEVALIMATSGTSGVPKLAELSHTALRVAVETSASRLGCGADDLWLSCLPVGHIGGMLVIVRALVLRCPVRVHPRFDVDAFERERDARFTSVVPTVLTRLLDAGADLARFHAILVGGAPLPSDVRARAEAAGARVVATYGLTESCGGVVYDGVPLEGSEVRIGEPGNEILLRAETLMRGYRLDTERTADALTPDGRLRTGDAGTFIAGRLLVHGRIDDLIVTGGENVWPSEVEEALRPHPAVRDVVVIGQPDSTWGHRVVAFVIPTDPSAPPTLSDVRAFLSNRLARHKAPHDVVVVESLPTTPLGKFRRPPPR